MAREEVKDIPKTHLVLLQSLRAVAAGMVLFFRSYLWQIKYFANANWLRLIKRMFCVPILLVYFGMAELHVKSLK